MTQLGGSMTQFRLNMFQEAINYAFEAHKGQKRKDYKTPYIIHPLTVAVGTASRTNDINTWIAAVLHDVVEDSEEPDNVIRDLEYKFGTDAANMVNILTRRKSAGETYDDYIDRIAKSNNDQVILIKIEDIKHNLDTIHQIDIKPTEEDNDHNIQAKLNYIEIRKERYDRALGYLFSQLVRLDSKKNQ
jgi:GTP diphosphokinase / guanosine-3',5'-bis(diphosphate) 3'-diphosphatase